MKLSNILISLDLCLTVSYFSDIFVLRKFAYLILKLDNNRKIITAIYYVLRDIPRVILSVEFSVENWKKTK